MDDAHKARKAELEKAAEDGTIDENGKKELDGIKSYESDVNKNDLSDGKNSQVSEKQRQDKNPENKAKKQS